MDADIKNLIRVGTVQSVDKKKMTARIKFDDKGGIISGELKIISRSRSVIEEPKGIGGKTGFTKLTYDQSGSTTSESHSHAAFVSEYIPTIGDMVLCIFLADSDGDGFVLGKVE